MSNRTIHEHMCIKSLISRIASTNFDLRASSSSSSKLEFGGVYSSIGGSAKRDNRTFCRSATSRDAGTAIRDAVCGGERFSGGGRVPRAMVCAGGEVIRTRAAAGSPGMEMDFWRDRRYIRCGRAEGLVRYFSDKKYIQVGCKQ
jgi:hypothetical protein